MNLTGTFLDFIIVFMAGILISFTPCLYPVMPITAAVIAGANAKGTRMAGFVLSCVYVFGLAVSYSILGIVAVLTGSFFGSFQASPYASFIIAAILIFFSLVMADLVRLPVLDLGIQGKIKPRNIFGVFLMGAASGFVVGPCTAPVLGTLLLYVASKKNLFHAASLLFVFSYGVGFSLILIGTFSGLLARLPRSGIWLDRVKKFCAAALFLIGIFFLGKAIALTGILHK